MDLAPRIAWSAMLATPHFLPDKDSSSSWGLDVESAALREERTHVAETPWMTAIEGRRLFENCMLRGGAGVALFFVSHHQGVFEPIVG